MINKDKNFNNRTKPPRCTMCNKILNEFDINGDFFYHKWIGYGSRYDENRLDLDLCGNCFDKVVSFIVNNSANNPLKEYDERQENGYFVRYLVNKEEEQIMGNEFDSIGLKHMFDEYIKATREIRFDFKYEEHLDKMFNNLKRIFMDLWV